MEARRAGTKQACDNCKTRKTKCDRSSPCSSCVAAELECKVTKRVPEKRQRVLISSRYDEAMENVNRSLEEVSEALRNLTYNNGAMRDPSGAASQGDHVSGTLEITEGYTGGSSFKAHVRRVTEALKEAAAELELNAGQQILPGEDATQLIEDAASDDPSPRSIDDHSSPLRFKYPELEGRSLPPLDPVLKLLRLAQSEKQQFFVDMPLIAESEFIELCQKAYFAIDDYSLAAWSIVNTGLFHLFAGLRQPEYAGLGISSSSSREIVSILTANTEAAIRSFRVCEDPSLETCRALDILATFCTKTGRSSMAWTLISAAARMCMDLGLHRLPDSDQGPDNFLMRRLFWHVYVMDKVLAFTVGRTPSIHPDDVSTSRGEIKDAPHLPEGLAHLYMGFGEQATIMGDIYVELFSAKSERASPQARADSAKALASRLMQMNRDLIKPLENSSATDPIYKGVKIVLDVNMHSLLTIIYRIIPSDESNAHPLQCNAACINSARSALSSIVRAQEVFGPDRAANWGRFLNVLLSLAPFASYVVLAGNTVASSSAEDLELLASTLSAIKPMSTGSPSGRKIYDVCKSFYQVASFSVARQAAVSTAPPDAALDASEMPIQPPELGFSQQLENLEASMYDHVMLPQDWDTVMGEFDIGAGVGAMASFIEPYLPFPT